GPSDALSEEAQLLDKARQLDLEIRATEDHELRTHLISALTDVRERLEEHWSVLAQYPDAIAYVRMRRGEGVSWDETAQWLGRQPVETALVEFVELRNSLLAFVIRAHGAEPRAVKLSLSTQELLDLVERYTASLRGETADSGGDGAAAGE